MSQSPPSDEELNERYQEFFTRVHDSIIKHGWHFMFVGAADDGSFPHFGYTIGQDRAERSDFIIVGGMDPETMHSVANTIITENRPLVPGEILEDVIGGGLMLAVRAVDHKKVWEYMTVTKIMALHQPTAVQIVWPDPEGRFPWDEDYDQEKYFQPLLEA